MLRYGQKRLYAAQNQQRDHAHARQKQPHQHVQKSGNGGVRLGLKRGNGNQNHQPCAHFSHRRVGPHVLYTLFGNGADTAIRGESARRQMSG